MQSGGSGGGASGATPGTGAIWLDNVEYTGTEVTIMDCPHNGWGNHNCMHLENLGVCCPGREARWGQAAAVQGGGAGP